MANAAGSTGFGARPGAWFDVVLQQAGWFAVVLGAAWSWPWAGAGVGLACVAAYLWSVPDRARQLRFVLEATALGMLVESVNAALGVYVPASGALAAGIVVPWMLVLWSGFATAFDRGFGWLEGRPGVAALLGALAGPVSFAGGARLGAISLADGAWPLALFSLEWALALPLLSFRATRVFREEVAVPRAPEAALAMTRPRSP